MKVRGVFMLLVLLVVHISYLTFFDNPNVDATSSNETHLQLMGKPSPVGRWLTTGFLNISSKIIVSSNESFSLNASFSAPPFVGFRYTDVKLYRLYENRKPEAIHHSAFINRKYTSRPIKESNPGEYYYQAVATVTYVLDLPYVTHTFFSNIMDVHINKEKVYATGIKIVNKENVYLNNFESYVTKYPLKIDISPDNANGKIEFINSNEKMATVGPDTRIITATSNKQGGTFKVTAKIKGANDKYYEDSASVEVGHGLKDQTAKAGGEATFTIMGDVSRVVDKIEWFKNDEKIQDGSSKFLHVRDLNMNSSNDIYRAEMIMGNGKRLRTNDAKINVIPNKSPNVKLDFSMINATIHNPLLDLNFFNNFLNMVAPRDKIIIQGTVQEMNSYSSLKKGQLIFKVPMNVDKRSIHTFVDDDQVDSNYDEKNNTVVVNNLDFSEYPTIRVKVVYKINSFMPIKFETSPKFKFLENNTDQDNTQNEFFGRSLGMEFIPNTIKSEGTNLRFVVNHVRGVVSEAYGKVMDPDDEVLKISDNRRDKPVTHVFLQLQEGQNTLFHPKYYYCPNGQSSQLLVPGQSVEIAKTRKDETLKSIIWKNNLKVVIPKDDPSVGQFKSHFYWYISDSI